MDCDLMVICELCGGRFETTATVDEDRGGGPYGAPPSRAYYPERLRCQPCLDLGRAPCGCPSFGCGGKLRGIEDEQPARFECRLCDDVFSVAVVRALVDVPELLPKTEDKRPRT